MLAMLVSQSLWDGHVWWEVPNLLGSTFYGPRAFRSGASMATLSGLALHFVITGSLGGLFGLAFGGIQQRGRLLVLGLLAAVGWYNLANATFWPKVNPWVLFASPRPATGLSHVLLGACLGYMGQRHRFSVRPAATSAPARPHDPAPLAVADSDSAEPVPGVPANAPVTLAQTDGPSGLPSSASLAGPDQPAVPAAPYHLPVAAPPGLLLAPPPEVLLLAPPPDPPLGPSPWAKEPSAAGSSDAIE